MNTDTTLGEIHMHQQPNLPLGQRGSSLIEIMVLLMVMGIGMLSMARIHTVLMREAGTAANRATATSLALEKIDDLRNFKYQDPAGSTRCGNGTFCFGEITTNAGGSENPDGTPVIAASATVNNTTFTRTWTITDMTGYKLVQMNVAWTDQNGPTSITVNSAILQDDSSIGTPTVGGGTGLSFSGPKVAYTPVGVPDVVPVSIDNGNGTNKETSKPLPDVSSKGYSVRTAFQSVVYKSGNKVSQEEFATVSCTCQFGASGAGYPASYYTYSNGALAVKYPISSQDIGGTPGTVSKMVGTAPTIQGDKQDELCSSCCADHHDDKTNTATALYDPDRPATDYVADGTDHKHYYFSNESNPQNGLVAVTPTAGNKYLESCRFLRVDGVFRLMQDWRQVDITTMPKDNYLTDGSTALTNYQTYVGNLVKSKAKSDGGLTSSTPSKSTLVTRDLTNQNAGLIQLMSRSIYVDRVYSSSSPRTLDSTFYTDTNTDSLSKIPFNEVNTTLLSSWRSSNAAVATVSNDTILDINATTSNYYGTYSRGRVQVLAGTGNNSDITAYMLPSTSGLTAGSTRSTYSSTVDYDATLTQSGTIPYSSEIGIDPDDHRSGNRKSDAINIARSGSVSSYTVSGVIKLGNTSGTLTAGSSALSISGTGGASCAIGTAVGSQNTFSCTVSSGYSGTITVTTALTNGFLGTSSSGGTVSTSKACTVSSVSAAATCPDIYSFGPTIRISGSCTDTGNKCSSSKVTLTATNGSCTKGSSPYCDVTLDSSTHVWNGSISVGTTGSNPPNVDIQTNGTTASCTSTSTKSVSLSSQGPANQTSAFNMCAQ